jgi:cytochrome c
MGERSSVGLRMALIGAAVVIAGWAALVAPTVAADLAYGKHLAGECTTCHRLDGSDKGIPPIIGWDKDAFVATLKFYKTGERNNPAMVSVAQSLDDTQMQALAAYFGSLKPR